MSEVTKSGNADIDGLLWGYKWDTHNLTFAFPDNPQQYHYEQINGFEAFNNAQKAAVIRALSEVASFTGLSFVPNGTGSANLDFAEATSVKEDANHELDVIETARGSAPDPETWPELGFGDMWFNHYDYENPKLGSFEYSAGIMHELGHALGLKHGHSEETGHGETFPELPSNHNSLEYSNMTYSQYVGDDDNHISSQDLPTSYMQDDIAALQYLYGANYDFRDSNTVYRWSPTTGEMRVNGLAQGAPEDNFVLQTIWDGGGTDTYDFSNYGATQLTVDLAPGAWTTLAQDQLAELGYVTGQHLARGSIANALLYQGNSASLIENAIGANGNDIIRGNATTNTLEGRGGDDYLDGREGLDVLKGGAGNDFYHLDDAGMFYGDAVYDFVMEGFGGGIDLVGVQRAAIGNLAVTSYALDPNIENAVVQGTQAFDVAGNSLDNRLFGNQAANQLSGGAGDDELLGDGGHDQLRGGQGGDLYRLTDAYADLQGSHFDDVIELAIPGIDTVEVGSAATIWGILDHYMLTANVENGIVTGTDGFDLTGNNLDNILTGNTAANAIDGAGGNDSVAGGSGQDSLAGGGGGDTLIGGASNDLLSGNSGRDAMVGAGGNDTILGGDGQDTLNAGTGNDQMSGNADADVFAFSVTNWGHDSVSDFQDGPDRLRFTANVADSFADFSVTGNGTTDVTLALSGQTIALHGAAAISLSSADFIFG